MRITCPSCAAEYDVPASRLTPSRTVRCARCGRRWTATLETEAPPPVSDPAEPQADHEAGHPAQLEAPSPTVSAMDRLAASVVQPPRSASLIGAWIATFVILTAAVAATIVWREPVVRAWPPISRILGPADQVAADVSRPAKE
jgi:predicted Zn finger-like uncharacterized protein